MTKYDVILTCDKLLHEFSFMWFVLLVTRVSTCYMVFVACQQNHYISHMALQPVTRNLSNYIPFYQRLDRKTRDKLRFDTTKFQIHRMFESSIRHSTPFSYSWRSLEASKLTFFQINEITDQSSSGCLPGTKSTNSENEHEKKHKLWPKSTKFRWKWFLKFVFRSYFFKLEFQLWMITFEKMFALTSFGFNKFIHLLIKMTDIFKHYFKKFNFFR